MKSKINFKREAISLCLGRRWDETDRMCVQSEAVPACF